MDELLNSVEIVTEVYEKYGLKGCIIALAGLTAVITAIIALAFWLGQ